MTVAQLPIPDSVARRAERFVGRKRTLHAIASWLDEPPGSRPWFVVVGGPGTGKSALLAWLAGSGPPPDDPIAATERDRVSQAVVTTHFCDADGGRAAPSLDPSG